MLWLFVWKTFYKNIIRSDDRIVKLKLRGLIDDFNLDAISPDKLDGHMEHFIPFDTLSLLLAFHLGLPIV